MGKDELEEILVTLSDKSVAHFGRKFSRSLERTILVDEAITAILAWVRKQVSEKKDNDRNYHWNECVDEMKRRFE